MNVMENSTLATFAITVATHYHKAKITFSWYDYGLFGAMLTVSAMIGIYFGCFGTKQSTTGEYLLGGKTMKVLPVVISLVASHVSAVTLLGVPADVYRYGSAYWLIAFSMIFVAILTAHVYLPVFYNLQITSTYEYLELRFDAKARSLASSLFGLSLVLFLPIVIYIPSLAFAAATGIDLYVIAPIVCGVCIFYTTIGGLKAVVWTDTLQFTITIGAVTAIFFLGISDAGGFQAMWQKAKEGDRLNLFDFDPNPFKRDSFWIIMIGFTTHWVSLTSINQSCIQKFLSVASLREAKITIWLYGLGIAILKTLSVLFGLIMYAKYSECDPFATGDVKRKDQLLPYYVMDVAGEVLGLPGLFIAGVVCAALSTLSAHLNCLAGTIYEDFIAKFLPENTTEKTASNILKLVVVIVGVTCTSLIFVVDRMGQILPLAIAFSSVTAGPILGLFTLGLLFPKANAKGAFWGTLLGLAFMIWLIFSAKYYEAMGLITRPTKPLSTAGCHPAMNLSVPFPTEISPSSNHTEPFILFKVSYYYYTIIGSVVTIILGMIISIFIRDTNEVPVRRELLSPVVHFLLPKEGKVLNADYKNVEQALNVISVGDTKEFEENKV